MKKITQLILIVCSMISFNTYAMDNMPDMPDMPNMPDMQSAPIPVDAELSNVEINNIEQASPDSSESNDSRNN